MWWNMLELAFLTISTWAELHKCLANRQIVCILLSVVRFLNLSLIYLKELWLLLLLFYYKVLSLSLSGLFGRKGWAVLIFHSLIILLNECVLSNSQNDLCFSTLLSIYNHLAHIEGLGEEQFWLLELIWLLVKFHNAVLCDYDIHCFDRLYLMIKSLIFWFFYNGFLYLLLHLRHAIFLRLDFTRSKNIFLTIR
jgi:hypothetical protein